MLWPVAAAALVAGLLIGFTGIGGVLVVPALTEAARLPVDRAIAASMFGFLFTGLVAAFVHVLRERPAWRELLPPCIAAALGAVAGALTLDLLPVSAIRLFIAALAFGSGLQGLLGTLRQSDRALEVGAAALAVIGLVVGYGSAVSGTGGPVMLVPVLLLLRAPIARAVALAQAIQIPIAATATVVNVAAGRVDFALGIAIGALLVAGTIAGAWLSGRARGPALTVAVGLTLIATGLWYAYATAMPSRP
jgi:uncharacterized membrane protein YfcA